ncbi:N-alpha-acetyltransferase 40 [Armadillidium nasatum]|uniref:N-alpha-acetyltransferase 40 n=1 Tax=Armadillidium nasatum TaxID=96803 RepID=A0A5N5T7H7_9CRUS|nr:N-alpha-acetyltransferase 40 [Armadillidium nasatum]
MRPSSLNKKTVKPSLQASYKYKSKISKGRRLNQSKKSKNVSINVLRANSNEEVLKPEILHNCEYLSKCQNLWKIESYSSLSLPKEVLSWAFELCKANVKKMYEETSGWDEEGKFNEMAHPAAKYIIIKEKDTNKLLAFSHFRFDVDYSEELHVIPEERSRGIGKFLLVILETLAITYKMEKVILTVFKSNTSAIKFYTKNGYEEDRTSPIGKSYVILSKYVFDGQYMKHCAEIIY